MILSRKPLGVSRLQGKSLCSYGSQACTVVCMYVSMLSLKCQRAFCSGCCCSSAQIPCTAGASVPHLLSVTQFRPSTGSLPPHTHPHFGMPSQHRGTNDWLTLRCNSCSRAPHGIRLKLMSTETTPIFSCPTCTLKTQKSLSQSWLSKIQTQGTHSPSLTVTFPFINFLKEIPHCTYESAAFF